MPAPRLFGARMNTDFRFYWFAVLAASGTALFAANLFRSRVGRALGPALPKLPMFTIPYNPRALSSIVTFHVELLGPQNEAGGSLPADAAMRTFGLLPGRSRAW